MSEDLLGEAESVHSSLSGGTTPDARSSSTGTSKLDIAKVLAQNNELKRLLIEEQRRCKQTEDERRKKDQELRRVEIEIDGFRFRNEQLLKRIEVLQSEMSSFNGKPTGNNSKPNKADFRQANDVVEQELMMRIQENSDLRNRLENLEASSKEQADLNAKRISGLEGDVLSAELKHQKATAGLKLERDNLALHCATLEKQLQQSSTDKDSTIAMLEAKVASLESQIQQSKGERSIASSVFLADTICPPEYLHLNLDYCDSEQAANVSSRQRSRSIASFSTNSDSLLLSIGAYGTSILTLIQRSGINTPMLTSSVGHTRSLIQKLQQSTNSVTNSNLVSQSASIIESLSGAIRQLISASDATLQASSHGVCETLDRLVTLAREASSVLLTNEIPQAASEWLRLAQLSSSGSGLVHDHYAALVVAFVGRVDVKPALDSALQALAAASSSLDTLSTLLDSRARAADVNASPLTASAAALKNQFAARTVALRASCRIAAKPPSVQYERAIELDASLAKAEAERTALAERAERLTKRLRTAEEEREKWMVEAQLRQVRYEKLLQRVTGSTPAVPTPSPMSPSSSISNLARTRENSVADFTEAAAASSNEPGVDITWLSKHFEDRISLVSSDAQRADSEAASWKAESRALIARLVQARQLDSRVAGLEKSLAERDDELETVRRSYESQLAAMAEHLATMNERIIKHADESEALQRQLRMQQQQQASSSSSKHPKKFLGKPG